MNRKLKPRILSVDDDPGIGALIHRLFHETGRYTVEVETDPLKAVQTAKRFRPDLIMLDVNMPGQDGMSIARRLREEPWLRYRPIVLFSSLRIPDSLLQSAGDSPVDFLHKGVPLKTIEETVDRLLGGNAAAD